jgi:tripartite-type tricarboxylate transporter receptor subunit TctC
MKTFIRKLLLLMLGAALCFGAQAQNYPQGPVKLVVPLTPGSGADTAARIMAKYLNKQWQQPVVVENKPGAGGLIGTGAVANADPNGQTLLFQSVTFTTNPATYKKLPYDLAKPLVNVAYLGDTPYVLVTSPDGPYKSIKDIVAAAKLKPGEIPFASVGVGSSTHFAAEYFIQAAGIKMNHIPLKGGPEAIQEVMSGRIAFCMASLSTALGQIKGGKLLALGVASKNRSPAANEIPTIAEQGFPNFDISLWFGLWAPYGTPGATVQKINSDIAKALQDPEVREAYSKVGIESKQMTTDEFNKFVKEEISRYQKIATNAQIELQ